VVPLEGTAWTGATPPVPADHLRFALIVPRLVAPHPDRGVVDPLTPEVALALMMQARVGESEWEGDHARAGRSASTTTAWRWALVRALEARVFHEDSEQLAARIADAPDPAGRVAATVMFASAQLEAGRAADARIELEQTLALDTASHVDYAWLCLQHARALVELGEVTYARQQALRAYSIRDVARHDVTATAISGVAATVLFNTADWGERNLGTVVQDSDTAVTWWRDETALRGADAAVEREFKTWTRDASVTIGGADIANQLYAAALSASHLGAHGTWAHFSSLLGRDALLRLDRLAPIERAAVGLTSLRLGGDEKALVQAGRRLLQDGPFAALRAAASAVRMEATTTSTVFADLALLKAAGDVLDEETARAATDWLSSALETLPDVLASSRTGRVFAVEPRLVEHLTATVAQTPAYAVQLAMRFVPAIPDVEDPLVDHAWGHFLNQIPPEAWDQETSAAVEPTERTTPGRLRAALREIRLRFDPKMRESVLDELKGGSLLALQALGDVTKIPSGAMRGITARLVDWLIAQREKAAKGATDLGGSDLAQALAVILSFHPDDDAFASLLEYLNDRAVARSLKRGALRTFISNSEHFSAA
jgi:predicted negative regulator of RcsB-dependent stress response